MTFAVIGGDARQARLASLLAADGARVAVFALEEKDTAIVPSATLAEAVAGAGCIVLPVPVLKNGVLNTPFSPERITAAGLFSHVDKSQIVVAGRVSAELSAAADGIRLIDYAAREDFMVRNAIPTAEGAIALAMNMTACTLHGARCLIIGFGRIGKILAHMLSGLGAKVTVSARKVADFVWIETYGYNVADTRRLESCLGTADIVFNTVPHMVLDAKRLRLLRRDCLCIDLASAPGGMNFTEAERLGIKYNLALSLPGKVAPETAACIERDTIYNILSELEGGE